MQIHTQQGSARKQDAVITVRLAWKSGDAAPVLADAEFPQFAALTGEREAGWPATGVVDTKTIGEISTFDSVKNEVTIITPFHGKAKLPAGGAITANDLGPYVLIDNEVVPYDVLTHTVDNIRGTVISTAAAQGDAVDVLHY